MLKRLFAMILACALLWSRTALAEIEFDISVFENDPNYEVEFDEMNDTGTIRFAEGSDQSGVIIGLIDDDDDSAIMGDMDTGSPKVFRRWLDLQFTIWPMNGRLSTSLS